MDFDKQLLAVDFIRNMEVSKMDKSVSNNNDYISIVIPWFRRSIYVNRVIDSIHKHANFPFELVIHDDGSDAATVFDLKQKLDKISTLILNSGKPLGLGESFNRAIMLASSKYVFVLNSDCELIRPCFKEIISVLQKPYLGWVGFQEKYNNCPEFIDTDCSKFSLLPSCGDGSHFAFRKEVWNDIGEFEADFTSGCADTPFFYKSWDHGYFRGHIIMDQPIKNISREETNNKDSTMGEDTELAYPMIFNIDYDKVCAERKQYCYSKFKPEQTKDAGYANLPYWKDYTTNILPEFGTISKIDWLEAKKHGQHKWKDVIEKENICLKKET